MIRSLRSHARSHEPNLATPVLRVDAAVVLLGGGGNVLGKSRRRSWNIEDHPMQNVLVFALNCHVGIVKDQRESDRTRRHMRPIQLWRNRVLISLREFVRNDAAVFEVGRRECQAWAGRGTSSLALRKGRAEARRQKHRSYSEFFH